MDRRRLDTPLLEREQNGISNAAGTAASIASDRQRRLDAADAALDPQLKEAHAVVSRRVIWERYPAEWVALFPTRVDATGRLIAGRLFGHAADRDGLEDVLRPLKAAHPGLPLFVYFTGRYPFGRRVVRV